MKRMIFGSGLSACKDFEGLYKVCKVALSCGIMSFDTAPSYRTESLISSAVSKSAVELGLSRDDYQIQTKIDPIQMYNGNVEMYFLGKLKEMQLDYVDSLLIHWPVEKYLVKTWESCLSLKKDGYVKHIGICNLRLRHLNKYKEIGIIPEILQIERHPLNTFEDEVQYCKENGIQLQDYSPLCKMHPKIKENEELKALVQKYQRDLGEIILRWHIDTGAIPVFTSTKPQRIEQYSHVEDFTLSQDDIKVISEMNCNHKLYLESLLCPGF